MRYPVYILVLLAALIAPSMQAAEREAVDELSRRIYNFEHRVMPELVHGSDGRLFANLIDRQGEGVRSIAAELVSPEFASQMRIKTIVPDKVVLITFPEPERALLCYQVIVAKTDSGYAYYTLEKVNDEFATDEVKAMYCSWVSGTTRQNFGSRSYTDAEAFTKEYLEKQGAERAKVTTSLPYRDAPAAP